MQGGGLKDNTDPTRPDILFVTDSRDEFERLRQHVRGYKGGRLHDEFRFSHIDCFSSLTNWYYRHRSRFVAMLVVKLDFSGIRDERKLIGHSGIKAPVPRGFDARTLQGFLVYAGVRQELDTIAPVLFLPSRENLKDAQQFANFVVYPGHGSCAFVREEALLPAGTAADADTHLQLYDQIARQIDASALRQPDDGKRRAWRQEHGMVVGRSRQMAYLVHEIERIGPSDAIVLLLGKPGVGKELVAHALHRCSHRFVKDDPHREYPYTVNIAAIDSNLIEDELFGHEKGAFTGAVGQRKGIFETAKGSTVLLDEIGDINKEIQLKLLRAMEYHLIKRLGSSLETSVDMRIISATNRSVEELQIRFRPDFYSRLVQHCIPVPSLRERWQGEDPSVMEQDIREMFEFVVSEMNRNPRHAQELDVDDSAVRFTHQLVTEYIEGNNDIFRGNMRTLRNIIERAYERAQYDGSTEIGLGHVISTLGIIRFMNVRVPSTEQATLEQFVGSLRIRDIEKKAIVEALAKHDGNQSRAAESLGIHRDTLRRKIAEYGIS